jgi:hypothetical protein
VEYAGERARELYADGAQSDACTRRASDDGHDWSAYCDEPYDDEPFYAVELFDADRCRLIAKTPGRSS